MRRSEAVKLIDEHKNKLIDPRTMLMWTWLRVIINQMTDEEWDVYVERAAEILSR